MTLMGRKRMDRFLLSTSAATKDRTGWFADCPLSVGIRGKLPIAEARWVKPV